MTKALIALVFLATTVSGQSKSWTVKTTGKQTFWRIVALQNHADTLFCTHEQYVVRIPLDSVAEIRRTIDFVWENTLTGAKIGALSGLITGIAVTYDDDYETRQGITDSDDKVAVFFYHRILVGALYSLLRSIVGGIVGFLIPSSTDHVHDLSSLDREAKSQAVSTIISNSD